MFRRIAFGALLLGFSASCSFAQAKDDAIATYQIAGKVTDEHKIPLRRARVLLQETDPLKAQKLNLKTTTDGSGHFTFNHPRCGGLTLTINPSLKAGLAQAVLTELPGEEGRHVLVTVRKGFLVRGRVCFQQQPVKDVTVKVQPTDGDIVHGGGQTVTDGKGRFALVLTGGDKIIEVTDIQNEQVVGTYRQKYKVVAEGTMPDLQLPPSK